MLTKEEHLWRLVKSEENLAEKDLRPWLAETLAERDEAIEKAKNAAQTIDKLTNELEEANKELAKLKAAQPNPQGGPFLYIGEHIVEQVGECRRAVAHCVDHASRLVCLLNAGLEAETLRARVAELGQELASAHAMLRSQSIGDAESIHAATEEIGRLQQRVAELDRHVSNYAQSYQDEKARADAAEETLRLVRLDLDGLSGKYREKLQELKATEADATEGGVTLLDICHRCAEALGSTGPDILGPQRAVLTVIERMRAAEAKLAALGENPIPRALVERWSDWTYHPLVISTLHEILANREPVKYWPEPTA